MYGQQNKRIVWNFFLSCYLLYWMEPKQSVYALNRNAVFTPTCVKFQSNLYLNIHASHQCISIQNKLYRYSSFNGSIFIIRILILDDFPWEKCYKSNILTNYISTLLLHTMCIVTHWQRGLLLSISALKIFKKCK